MTTSQFFMYTRRNEIAKQAFAKEISSGGSHTRASVYIEGVDSCSEKSGCPCHSSDKEEIVCQHLQSCPEVSCSKPIKMKGFCCPQCGTLNILKDYKLKLCDVLYYWQELTCRLSTMAHWTQLFYVTNYRISSNEPLLTPMPRKCPMDSFTFILFLWNSAFLCKNWLMLLSKYSIQVNIDVEF